MTKRVHLSTSACQRLSLFPVTGVARRSWSPGSQSVKRNSTSFRLFICAVPTRLWLIPTLPSQTTQIEFPAASICSVPRFQSARQWNMAKQDSVVGFYRASICEGGPGSRNSVRPSVRLSVRPSVTRVDCDKTKRCTADILIPHERAITLLLRYQQWLVGDASFPLKSALKVTHPLRKTPTSTDFCS